MKVHHISWYVPMSHDIPSFVGENPPFYSESHGARRVPWRQRAQNARQSLQQAMQGPIFWGRYPWHLFLLAPPKHENWGTIQLLLVCLICQNCEPTWVCLKSVTNWVNPSEMATLPIDLQRALFSVHSIFWLDLPPFRLFVHTWGAECTLVSWQAGIYASTGYFGATSREETNRIFFFIAKLQESLLPLPVVWSGERIYGKSAYGRFHASAERPHSGRLWAKRAKTIRVSCDTHGRAPLIVP